MIRERMIVVVSPRRSKVAADLRGKVEADVSKRASVEARSIGLGAMLGVAEVSVM